MMLSALPDPSSYTAVGWILVALAALATGANQLLRLLDRTKEQPPPADTYVRKEHCHTLHHSTEEAIGNLSTRLKTVEGAKTDLAEAMHGQISQLRREMKEDFRQVHSRIDELVRAVGRIEGTK